MALKVLHASAVDDAEKRRRFGSEAALLVRNPHPALVPLLDADLEAVPPYLAFAYMEGGDVAAHRDPGQLLPQAEVLRLALRLAAALEHLHGRGVLHRDLKPENVLRDAAGDFFLGDLGLGQDLDATRATQEGVVVGTLEYLAPEVEAGSPASAASDLFSLGVLLTELLTGVRPRVTGAGSRLPESELRRLPPELVRLLRELLRSSPEDRPAHASEVLGRLRSLGSQAAARPPVQAPPASGDATLEVSVSVSVPAPPSPLHPVLVALGLLAITTSFLGGRALAGQASPPSQSPAPMSAPRAGGDPDEVPAPSPGPLTLVEGDRSYRFEVLVLEHLSDEPAQREVRLTAQDGRGELLWSRSLYLGPGTCRALQLTGEGAGVRVLYLVDGETRAAELLGTGALQDGPPP